MKKDHRAAGNQRLLWLTDPHLEKAPQSIHEQIMRRLEGSDYDIALCTGDIATADTLPEILPMMAEACGERQLYIVLGNHDFKGATTTETISMVDRICHRHGNLTHLATSAPIRITEHTTLVGHHGLSGKTNRRLQDSSESCRQIRRGLFASRESKTRLLVATHYPPFRTAVMFDQNACGHRKPTFCHEELGYMMIHLARKLNCPSIQVLGGHTHHAAEDVILHNLTCRVGRAGPGHTGVQGILMV